MQHRNAAVRSDTRAMKIDKPQVRPTAGVTLKAVEALRDQDVQHFTREQVAYLMHLACLSGAEHRRAFDLAELIATWDANTTPRQTREQRIAWEMQRYAEQAELRELREADRKTGKPLPPCEWPEVAQPGRPDLRAAA